MMTGTDAMNRITAPGSGRYGLVAVTAAVTFVLASCGGSDDGGPAVVAPPASNQPPASASQNVDGFIAYLKLLVVTKPETTEPLDVTAFVAPTTDTSEPDPSI